MMDLTSDTQATKKVKFLNYVYGKGIQCHSNHSRQLFELKNNNNNNNNKKQQKNNKSRYLNVFFVIFFS